jgi:hypothetical protein
MDKRESMSRKKTGGSRDSGKHAASYPPHA